MFVKYTGGKKVASPKASINSKGFVFLNKGAVINMGLSEAKYVELYYDEQRAVIGMKFVSEENDGASKIRIRNSACVFSARGFLGYNRINIESTSTYSISKDEESGLYVIDLSKKEP